MTIANEADDVPLGSPSVEEYTEEQLIVEIRDIDDQIEHQVSVVQSKAMSRIECEKARQQVQEDFVEKLLGMDDLPVEERQEYKKKIHVEAEDKLEKEMLEMKGLKKDEDQALSRIAVLHERRQNVYDRLMSL